MDLQPQASFIPKKPLTSTVASRSGSHGVLWIIALFIFIASVGAATAVFIYGAYLNNQLTSAKDSLDRARAAYDPTSIGDLIRLNSRIKEAKVLLARHVAPSAVFSYLEQNTLPTVRFNQLEYTNNPDGTVSMKLAGNAVDFASVALQSDQFSKSPDVLKNVIFSSVNNDSSGIVGFEVAANFNPTRLLYSNVLAQGGSSAPESQNPTSTTGSAGSTTTTVPIPPSQ